jgi:hypothetical protein
MMDTSPQDLDSIAAVSIAGKTTGTRRKRTPSKLPHFQRRKMGESKMWLACQRRRSGGRGIPALKQCASGETTGTRKKR